MLHISIPAYGIILLGIHVGLHWTFIKSIAVKVIKVPERLQKSLGLVGLTVIIGLGGYNVATTNIIRHLYMPFIIMAGGTAGPHGGQNFKGKNRLSESEEKEFDKQKGTAGREEKGKNKRPENTQGAASGIDILAVFNLIISYLSIIALIGAATVWIEKLTQSLKNRLS